MSRERAVDSGGTVRHITRDVHSWTADAVLGDLTWSEVLSKLVGTSTSADERVRANMPDTLILESGVVVDYLFTSTDGYLSRKPRSALTMSHALEEFLKIAARLQDQVAPVYVATVQQNEGAPLALGMTEFQNLCTAPPPEARTVVQCFVPSKGNATTARTYRCKYWLDDGGLGHMKSEKLDVNSVVSGNAGIKSKTNMDKTTNSSMERNLEQMIWRIQSAFHVKVVKTSAEFVQDISGKVWLLRMDGCTVATDKSATQHHPSSPSSSFRQQRVAKVAEFGENVGLLQSGSVDSLNDGFARSKPSSIGQHSDGRVERRIKRDAVPDDVAVERIMSISSRTGSRRGVSSRGGRRPGSSSPVRSPNRSLSPEAKNATFNIPNARLGSEVPIAESTGMFGSTQLNGCQGDFCKFDLHFIENP